MLQSFCRILFCRGNKVFCDVPCNLSFGFGYRFLQVWMIFIPVCVKGKSEVASCFGLNAALQLSIAKETILNVNQRYMKLGQALLEY